MTPDELLNRIKSGSLDVDDRIQTVKNEPPALKGIRTQLTGWIMSAPPVVAAAAYAVMDWIGVDPQIVIDTIAEFWRFIVAAYPAGGYLVKRYRDEA